MAAQRYGRLIGQRALQYTILGATAAGATAIGALLMAVSQLLPSPLVGVLVGAVIIVAGFCVSEWLAVRWSVTLECVVIENARVGASLDRSAGLVRGAWWRVFGYTLLLGLMVSFAVSLVATPVVFFTSLPGYARVLGDLLHGSAGSADFPVLVRSLLSGMGGGLAVLMYIEGLFSAFVVPVFMTLLFLELRRRADAPDPRAVPAAPPEPQAAP